MNPSLLVLLIVVAYLLVILGISHWAARHASNHSNEAFFSARRRAPWQLVALGMIAGSISGVSFISVPAWVGKTSMTYLQMCMGFIVGYFVVAWVLLPLYYRLQLTSIYGYLLHRFGKSTQQTGALFFIISKLLGAAARLYLACLVLHYFVAAPFHLPFWATASLTLLLIWLYTRSAGQASLLYTDVLQTLCMLFALVGTIVLVLQHLNFDLSQAWIVIHNSPMSQVFEWDASSKQAFWRQFLSGIFIVIVMTGLDQDMMQKNLTCKNLRDAQKDMCVYGLSFLPINALLLALGVLIYHFCQQKGITIPERADQLLPQVIATGMLGTWILVPFTLGIVSAAFSAVDGAMAAITTSCCVDFSNKPVSLQQRRYTHLLVALAFLLCVLMFDLLSSSSLIDTIFRLASYSYGPLLGLFIWGIYTQRQLRSSLVPVVCLLSPFVAAGLDLWLAPSLGISLGYELLLINALFTILGLWLISHRPTTEQTEMS